MCKNLLFWFSGQAGDKYHGNPPNIFVICRICQIFAEYFAKYSSPAFELLPCLLPSCLLLLVTVVSFTLIPSVRNQNLGSVIKACWMKIWGFSQWFFPPFDSSGLAKRPLISVYQPFHQVQSKSQISCTTLHFTVPGRIFNTRKSECIS